MQIGNKTILRSIWYDKKAHLEVKCQSSVKIPFKLKPFYIKKLSEDKYLGMMTRH